MVKKLREITEAPKPNDEALAAAEKAGVDLLAYDPARVLAFMEGRITLGDLQGIGKDAQYRMAETGFQYLAEGKLDLARDVFEGLLALDPFDAYFHTAMGSVAQQTGELEAAEASYGRALEINPFSATAYANRGEVRVMLGKLVEAADDIAKALAEDPEGKEPATQRARATAVMLRKELEAQQQQPA